MSFVLETRSLVKDYGGKIALSGIDLALPEGKIIGLLGSNGSGKTTLLKLAAGLLQPTSGEIRVCERGRRGNQKSRFLFAGAHVSERLDARHRYYRIF